MKSKVVALSCYGASSGAFDKMLSDTLKVFETDNCMIHDIEYSTVSCEGSTVVYSALILYDEVPTRKVIIEKTNK